MGGKLFGKDLNTVNSDSIPPVEEPIAIILGPTKLFGIDFKTSPFSLLKKNKLLFSSEVISLSFEIFRFDLNPTLYFLAQRILFFS